MLRKSLLTVLICSYVERNAILASCFPRCRHAPNEFGAVVRV